MSFKSRLAWLIDKILNAMIFIIALICIASLVFFYTIPINLITLVPFDIFFGIYFCLVGIEFWAVVLCPRRLQRNPIIIRLRSFEFYICLPLFFAAIIAVMHWETSKYLCFAFYRKYIPFFDEILGYK